jgi:hypothetical protein
VKVPFCLLLSFKKVVPEVYGCKKILKYGGKKKYIL